MTLSSTSTWALKVHLQDHPNPHHHKGSLNFNNLLSIPRKHRPLGPGVGSQHPTHTHTKKKKKKKNQKPLTCEVVLNARRFHQQASKKWNQLQRPSRSTAISCNKKACNLSSLSLPSLSPSPPPAEFFTFSFALPSRAESRASEETV